MMKLPNFLLIFPLPIFDTQNFRPRVVLDSQKSLFECVSQCHDIQRQHLVQAMESPPPPPHHPRQHLHPKILQQPKQIPQTPHANSRSPLLLRPHKTHPPTNQTSRDICLWSAYPARLYPCPYSPYTTAVSIDGGSVTRGGV
jgi:hypothetical protein